MTQPVFLYIEHLQQRLNPHLFRLGLSTYYLEAPNNSKIVKNGTLTHAGFQTIVRKRVVGYDKHVFDTIKIRMHLNN